MKHRIILSALLIAASLAAATSIAATLANRVYLPVVAAYPTPSPSASTSPAPSASASPSPSGSAAPGPSASAAPSPSASTEPSPPPPSFNNCQADSYAASAPNYPVRIDSLDKAGETVTLRNRSSAAVTVTGWRICSITGNQLHATLSGTLAPGEVRVIPSQAGGSIWNNSTDDDGALYNAAGQLIAYFDD